eukprot:TRINITY_DN9526_c0_g1_i1.p1 TRINITY_DN9526_c0_g1~~TRINITY_DN9526_c0_g1_i1.p1  ORF type:complete len:496 (+),score=102.11 TRINITY_DN9526_c0_g1_i1:59-1546(+)
MAAPFAAPVAAPDVASYAAPVPSAAPSVAAPYAALVACPAPSMAAPFAAPVAASGVASHAAPVPFAVPGVAAPYVALLPGVAMAAPVGAKKWSEKAAFQLFIDSLPETNHKQGQRKKKSDVSHEVDIESQIISGSHRVGDKLVVDYCVADELRDDKEIIIAITRKWQPGFDLASDKLKDDSDFCKDILALDGCAGQICHMSSRIRQDPEFVKIALSSCGDALRNLSDEIRDDEDMVKIAVAQKPTALQYASERLKGKSEIFVLALDLLIAQGKTEYDIAQLVKHASASVKADKSIMSKATVQGKCGRVVNETSEALRDDKEFVMDAFKASSSQYCPDCRTLSDRLRNDLDVMKLAVENNSMNMRDASDSLKDSDALILHCVSIPDMPGHVRGDAIQFCSDRIRGDKALALEVCKKSASAFKHLNKELLDEPELLKLALAQDPWAIEKVSDRLRNDEAIMLDMLSINMDCLQFVHNDMVNSAKFKEKVQALRDAKE